MATLFDNLVVQQTVAGNALVEGNWYSYVDSFGTCQATYKGREATHTGASDYHILLSTVNADSDSNASPEADCYTTDASGNTFNAFVISGSSMLTYPSTNIIKANKGSIAFMWKAPLPYNKFTANFKLVYLPNFLDFNYRYNEKKFYYVMNDGGWVTCITSSNAQTFGANDWLKFCITWDTSSATTMALYIDSSTPDDTYGSSWTAQTIPSTLYIGVKDTGISQSDGAFDELRIYSEASTSAKVETLFSTTWGGY